MRTFVTLLAAAALAAPLTVVPARGEERPHKALSPAFGKELVPDHSSQEYKGPSEEIEERVEEEKEEGATERPRLHRSGGGGGRAGRVRIQLDGDEDGGGGGVDGDF